MLRRLTTLCLLLPAVTLAESPPEPGLAEPVVVVEKLEARVVTGEKSPDECLAPVAITHIDGTQYPVSARGFSIEPGRHYLNGKAVLDTGKCWPLETSQYIPSATDLEVDLEAGKAYYLAYDRSHPDPAQWGLVVWKVEVFQLAPVDGPVPDGAIPVQ